MKSLLIILQILLLTGPLHIHSKEQKNETYFIFETPRKVPGKVVLNFLKINNNDEIEIKSFVIWFSRKGINKLSDGWSNKEKISYKLLENGNLSFGDKIAYSTENFKLSNSMSRRGEPIKGIGVYDLLGEDFLNQSNDEKRLSLIRKIKSGIYKK